MRLRMQSGSRRSRAKAHSALAIPRCGPASPFRGHLSTKSNAFCVDSSRNLTSQYLIRDHMVFHYDRILSAKAAVDCSVPKSRMNSIKFADQQRREKLKKKIAGCEEKTSICETVSRSCPRDGRVLLPSSYRKTFVEAEANLCPCAGQAQYLSAAPSPCGERGLGRSSQIKCARKCSPTSFRASYPKANLCALGPANKRSHSVDSFMNATCSPKCQGIYPRASSGDLLERHSEYFTKSRKPFTPRTLKSDAKSFLSEYRYYTPAARRKRKNRRKQQRMEAQTQTDMMSFPSADNMCVRKVVAERQKIKSKGDSKRCTPDEPERGTDAFQYSMLRETSQYPQKSSPRRCVKDEEEELLYLTFIEDVTNEILNLGLFSNSVLDQLFECHIEENKNRLDEVKMRQMLDVLKLELGCGVDSETELTHADQEALDLSDGQEFDTGEELEFTSKGHRLRKATKSEEEFETMDSSLKEPNKRELPSCRERLMETQSREDFAEDSTEMLDAATESDFCGVEFEEHPDTSPTCQAALNLVASDSDLEVIKELDEAEESLSRCGAALRLVASDSELEVNKELDEPEESFSTCEGALNLVDCESDLEVNQELEPEESLSTSEGALNLAACESDLEDNKELDEVGESFAKTLHISHNYA